ncbi:tyrosine protein kinase, putative, partial [Entamoeba invadens IP1]
NIQFEKLQGGVCVNKVPLDFNEDSPELPLDKETRQLICVGNVSERTMKVQFSLKTDEEKFSIRFNPEVCTLRKGCACEFEVFISPVCTCKIDSSVMIISKSLKQGKEAMNKIELVGTTVYSIRLDPGELVEENKLGEGSFGIVIKGKFRGNEVAIKKMKQANTTPEALNEFDKEVKMLDKFRCDFIVHFYGAVFIKSKMCMVTEFARYGSLQDLIRKNKDIIVLMKMRLKLMLDAARGIAYLHKNGILHRDIKPDNILVISLEDKMIANGKLTDFGSSRNINMLMTNMTFTKGIGSPKYMAPEVLNKEKYKHAADVYSFSITMYECLGWCEAFGKEKFPLLLEYCRLCCKWGNGWNGQQQYLKMCLMLLKVHGYM